MHAPETSTKRTRTLQTTGGEGEKIRERLAAEVLAEALEALQSDIDIAIYDASNINAERRRVLNNTVAASGLHAKVRRERGRYSCKRMS